MVESSFPGCSGDMVGMRLPVGARTETDYADAVYLPIG
jgi:hypothetical protein